MKVFTTGTIVQVFLLSDSVEPDMWSTTEARPRPQRPDQSDPRARA
jgi:hypothetical protein